MSNINKKQIYSHQNRPTSHAKLHKAVIEQIQKDKQVVNFTAVYKQQR